MATLYKILKTENHLTQLLISFAEPTTTVLAEVTDIISLVCTFGESVED
jgi:hypothetical protein